MLAAGVLGVAVLAIGIVKLIAFVGRAHEPLSVSDAWLDDHIRGRRDS